MEPIKVLSVEPDLFKSFIEGDPVEIRTDIPEERIGEYGKGSRIRVRFCAGAGYMRSVRGKRAQPTKR